MCHENADFKMKTHRNKSALLSALAGLFLLNSCSVTDFREPVNEMAAAVESSVTAIEAIDHKFVMVRNARLRRGIAEGSVALETSSDRCALGKPSCALEAFTIVDGKPKSQRVFPLKTVIPKARAGFSVRTRDSLS